MAIGYLAEPVVGVTPLPTGNFSRTDLGKRFAIVGYGEQSDRPTLAPGASDTRPASVVGKRRLGAMTLRALAGDRLWEPQYPTFDAFVTDDAKWDQDPTLAADPTYRADHVASWDRRLTDADAILGGVSGDAASAGPGDSGAPILGLVGGKITILALSSKVNYLGPRPAPFNPASLPLTAATFGSDAQYFLASRPACGLASASGDCNGETIVRCTSPNEGAPQLLETDCAAVGLQCGSFGRAFNVPSSPHQCIPACATDADCTGIVAAAGTCTAGRCTWKNFP
jgi:hypothetical protein